MMFLTSVIVNLNDEIIPRGLLTKSKMRHKCPSRLPAFLLIFVTSFWSLMIIKSDTIKSKPTRPVNWTLTHHMSIKGHFFCPTNFAYFIAAQRAMMGQQQPIGSSNGLFGLRFLEEIRDDKVHHRLEMLSTKDDDGVCHLLAVIMGISKFPFSKGPSHLLRRPFSLSPHDVYETQLIRGELFG